MVHIFISQCVGTNTVQEYYFLPLAEFVAKVEITLPNVRKLYNGSG